MAGEYLIRHATESRVYLRKIEQTKRRRWETVSGFLIQRAPGKRKNVKTEVGTMITAEYTPEIRKAKRFESLEAAEEYIRKHGVLRFCRIVRAEE